MSRGRRIVRLKMKTPSKEIEQKYLMDWSVKHVREAIGRLPKLTSKKLFDNELPLEVEIGPGTAEYLCDLALQNSEKNYLGIEASRKSAYLAIDLAAKLKLENIRIIKANFQLLNPIMLDQRWEKVYLHFPDPVHKRKDEKNRIFTTGFLDKMSSVLVSGGKISVVSDNVHFIDEMLKIAKKHPSFEFAHQDSKWIDFQPREKSRFQIFWERKGVIARRFIIVKH
jgi:tRNA (guanine-N7-)-methyltransferase